MAVQQERMSVSDKSWFVTSRRISPLPSSVVRASPPPVRATGAAPIILTGMMGAANQRHFDALRRQHYPEHRNHVPAHITLFHHLAPALLPELCDVMRRLSASAPAPRAEVVDIMTLGEGTAFRVHSLDLLELRAMIADHFHGMITQQDQGTPRLHITVQNKVTRKEAADLQRDLARTFQPHTLEIHGLAAFHYRDGPWEPAFSIRFRGRAGRG